MDENSKQTIQLQINKLKNLPALPEVSVKILEAINNPELPIDRLAEVLSLSPGLVARLLGLANSAYFGQSRQINDLRTAIFQVLGLEMVKSLALSIVLNVHFDAGKCKNFDTEYFWMRSLVTAVAAQKLATENRLPGFSASTVYTSGLLLYIGILVMAYLFPEELDDILLHCRNDHFAVGDEIGRQLGLSHYQIGYALLQKWHLSPVYQAVLHHFEATDESGDELRLIQLLKAAQQLSSMVLDERIVESSDLETLAIQFSLSVASLSNVLDELLENRQDIQKLAFIMGS